MLEVQGHAQRLLAAIFEMVITDEAAGSILESYPELTWLANCLRRCPLPPGWTAADAGHGNLRYINMGTGKSQEESPLMEKFADMGRLMLHWRRSPGSAADVAAALKAKHEHDLEEATRARKVWKGPHIDPDTGIEFWHCPATGRSAWGDPGMASEFLSRVADRLQRAIPVAPSSGCLGTPPHAAAAQNDPTPSTMGAAAGGTTGSPIGSDAGASADPHRGGPCAGTLERQAVRQMMAEIAANAVNKAQAEERPRPAGRHGSRPVTGGSPAPRAPSAPASQNTGQPAVREEVASGGAIEGCQDMGERGRRLDRALREAPAQDGSGRKLLSAEVLSSEADTYVRPECRRRRLDSSERLNPLEGAGVPGVAGSHPAPPASLEPAAAEEPGLPSEPGACAESAAPGHAPSDAAAPPSAGRPKSRRGAMDQSFKQIPETSGPLGTLSAEAHQGTSQLPRSEPARQPPKLPAAAAGSTEASASALGGEPTCALNRSFKAACSRGMSQSFKRGAEKTAAADVPNEALAATAASNLGASLASHLGSTALVGQMCAGAIAAAIDEVFVAPEDVSASMEDECDEQEALPMPPNVMGQVCAVVEEAAPPSPSLMSICRPLSPTSGEDQASPRAESPSLLVLDDGPRWTWNKPLPRPCTPPRSPRPRTPPRSSRGERPVLLGAPEPLSARARCGANEPPLSARLKGARTPRPGGRRTPKHGGA